jgi:asparagine synthase (glutamine-hydrolysing)
MLREVDGPLFKAPHQEDVARLAMESLRSALEPAAALAPLQRVWHLFVTQRLRRETALSLVKFGSVVEVRLPYLDNDLVSLLLAMPVEMKLAERIQTYILQRRMPEFLKVVNSNTGARVGAGETVRKLSTLRMRILAKLGVRGYQPYERLGLWLRRELAPMVEEILLDERMLDEGIFEPDTVRKVFDQHQKKQRNHTYLLMAMMIYELGRRRLSSANASTAFSSPTSASSRRRELTP